ncbi:MAG: class I SAM-dependent methyltransferase [Acidobacteria bacterium]|nr:class I SAM-dependent methyltransferase [Acidobacteriota bacterium]
MRILIDTETRRLTLEDEEGHSEMDLYTPEAFAAVSRHWVRVGWAQRYSYGFTWLGRPVIQLPEDLVRTQEVIWRTRPDVIVETGVAHGGSLIFYAGLFELMGHGQVVGIDIEIRPQNRTAIEAHPLASRIRLVEGSSTDPAVVDQVKQAIPAGSRVMVLLDSNHTKAHVRAELEAYAPLVTAGCYVVATDGIMCDLHDVPGGHADWAWDHATAAAAEFAAARPEFVIENPPRLFEEGSIREPVTYWPGGWLRRR